VPRAATQPGKCAVGEPRQWTTARIYSSAFAGGALPAEPAKLTKGQHGLHEFSRAPRYAGREQSEFTKPTYRRVFQQAPHPSSESSGAARPPDTCAAGRHFEEHLQNSTTGSPLTSSPRFSEPPRVPRPRTGGVSPRQSSAHGPTTPSSGFALMAVALQVPCGWSGE